MESLLIGDQIQRYETKLQELNNAGHYGQVARALAYTYAISYTYNTTEVSNAVLETFGSNLLHDPSNTDKLAGILVERKLGFRAEQLLEEVNEKKS